MPARRPDDGSKMENQLATAMYRMQLKRHAANRKGQTNTENCFVLSVACTGVHNTQFDSGKYAVRFIIRDGATTSTVRIPYACGLLTGFVSLCSGRVRYRSVYSHLRKLIACVAHGLAGSGLCVCVFARRPECGYENEDCVEVGQRR